MVSEKGVLLGGGGARLQIVNGSPVYPAGHEQLGVWLMTLHIAPTPQDPGHGSIHFSLIQALLLGQSALMAHSGRQFGGEPK